MRELPSRSFGRSMIAIALTIAAVPVLLAAQGTAGRQGAARGGTAAPSSAMPEIVIGGIQVAKVVVSKDDFSAKPFHSDNGTMIVLWVKMPTGIGLIEIDEDASLLQSFKDDKGTDLGGKFGSFPDEFKDGTGGIIEIESSAIPASGSTALLAEGTVAMAIATGTKPTRVANVQIQNDRKFTMGATSMTVAEVETDGEDLKFTVKLPRSVLTTVKDVKFLDAKGTELEGRRTGSGYSNDAGEMSFSVKTALKVITLEFEVWQGLRTIKAPFKVKAGIGLGGTP